MFFLVVEKQTSLIKLALNFMELSRIDILLGEISYDLETPTIRIRYPKSLRIAAMLSEEEVITPAQSRNMIHRNHIKEIIVSPAAESVLAKAIQQFAIVNNTNGLASHRQRYCPRVGELKVLYIPTHPLIGIGCTWRTICGSDTNNRSDWMIWIYSFGEWLCDIDSSMCFKIFIDQVFT